MKIAAFCVAGYFAAVKGIIDLKCRKQLNRLNISIFTPALIFGKVSFFLTREKLASLWVIPLGFVIITSVSFGVSCCLGKAFRLPKPYLNLAIAGSIFMNTNTIPIALIQSLSLSLDKLQLDELDTADKEVGRAFCYLSVFSLLGSLLRWSYGIKLLKQADPTVESVRKRQVAMTIDREKVNFPASGDTDWSSGFAQARPKSGVSDHGAASSFIAGAYRISCPSSCSANSGILQSTPRRSVRFSYPTSFGAYPNILELPVTSKAATRMSSATSFSADSEATHCDTFAVQLHGRGVHYSFRSETGSGSQVAPLPHDLTRLQPIWENPTSEGSSSDSVIPGLVLEKNPIKKTLSNTWRKARHKVECAIPRRVKSFLRAAHKFANPPLTSSILSIVVACIPPVQKWLGNIKPLRNFLNLAGSASIPITLVVLGAFFFQPDFQGKTREDAGYTEAIFDLQTVSRERSGSETKTIIISLISRQLLAPLLLLPTMYISARYSSISAFSDPVFLLTMILLTGAPPAITLAQMTTERAGRLDGAIARMLLWSFVFITPLTTLVLVGIAIKIHDLKKG